MEAQLKSVIDVITSGTGDAADGPGGAGSGSATQVLIGR